MTLTDLIAYINVNMLPGQKASISGTEVKTALLEICNQIQGGQSWTPAFSLYGYNSKILMRIQDWTGGQGTKPATGQYMTAGGYTSNPDLATDIRGPQGTAGLPGSGLVNGITSGGDGINIRYYPICELPVASGGTYDFARIQVTVKFWDNSNGAPTEISLYVSNRGGFVYEWKCRNSMPSDSTSIVAIQDSNGKTYVLLRLNNNFKAFSVRVPDYFQATITATSQYQTNLPAGTTVLDTNNPDSYPPYMVETSYFPSFNVTNTASGFPKTYFAAGKGLLSLGGNMKSGASEVDFINSNLYSPLSSGFAFLQMITANSFRELAYLNGAGYMGVGSPAPSSRMHLKGDPTMVNNANGITTGGAYQLRLELSYTPTGTNDPAGNVGDICWDGANLYLKTAAGWKKLTFQSLPS